MPYGISKDLGGDSKKNDAKMEAQVTAIMKHGVSKVSAIKIAKAQMERHHHEAARPKK
jgi:hypothetical protein